MEQNKKRSRRQKLKNDSRLQFGKRHKWSILKKAILENASLLSWTWLDLCAILFWLPIQALIYPWQIKWYPSDCSHSSCKPPFIMSHLASEEPFQVWRMWLVGLLSSQVRLVDPRNLAPVARRCPQGGAAHPQVRVHGSGRVPDGEDQDFRQSSRIGQFYKLGPSKQFVGTFSFWICKL